MPWVGHMAIRPAYLGSCEHQHTEETRPASGQLLQILSRSSDQHLLPGKMHQLLCLREATGTPDGRDVARTDWTDEHINTIYTCRLEWHADKPVAQLTEADVGKFFEIGASNIPEAFQDWYATSAAAGETFVEKGGCKGLQVRPSCNFATNKQHVYMAIDKPHTFQIHVADRP